VVEEQPISVQEQGLPANQPEGVAAGALPEVDGNPADELGPAAAAAALNGPLPESQAQGVVAGTKAEAMGAVAKQTADEPAADAAGVDAGAVAEAAAAADATAEPDAGAGVQAAAAVAAAAGNTVAAVGAAADAVRASAQEKARYTDNPTGVSELLVHGFPDVPLRCTIDTDVPETPTLHVERLLMSL
jgi:hypothetical protein